mgnify:FL=1|tara:strand:+ start:1541 stop:1759 length:219 start_codon:yes stop_codon:yes gene_type:complete
MLTSTLQDALEARRKREVHLSVNTNLGLRVTLCSSTHLKIKAMALGSNPSELARVLMDEGAKSLGFDLETIL